jgi:hypothetical protein
LEIVGLRRHPDRTTIVYRGDDKRRSSDERTSFTFPGYAFHCHLTTPSPPLG